MNKSNSTNIFSIFIASISSLLFGISITSFGITETISNSIDHPFLSTLAIANVFLGGVIAAILLNLYNKIGLKRLITISSILQLIGNLIILFFPNIFSIPIARAIIGIGFGITGLTVPLYVFNLSPPRLKGFLSNLHPMNINIGVIIGHCLTVLGQKNMWRYGIGVICAISTISIFLSFFIADGEVKQETKKGLMDLYIHKDSFKSILIVSIFHLAQHISGIDYVVVFLQKILKDTSNPFYFTIGIISLSIPSNLLCGYLTDVYGRKPLMIVSCLTVSFSCLLLFLFDKPQFYMPIFLIGYNLGLSNIPWLIQNELAPPEYVSSITSLGVQVNWLSAFFIVQLFISLTKYLERYSWLLYGFFMVLIAMYTYFSVPETKDQISYNFVN